jgi:hypothetical protein
MAAGTKRLPCRHGQATVLGDRLPTHPAAPEGGSSDPLAGSGLIGLLSATIKHAKHADRVRLEPPAREPTSPSKPIPAG